MHCIRICISEAVTQQESYRWLKQFTCGQPELCRANFVLVCSWRTHWSTKLITNYNWWTVCVNVNSNIPSLFWFSECYLHTLFRACVRSDCCDRVVTSRLSGPGHLLQKVLKFVWTIWEDSTDVRGSWLRIKLL